MKKIFNATILLLVFQNNYSQNRGVENSLFNLQIGVLGVWISNEAKLSYNFVIRSEIGLDAGVFGGEINKNSGIFIVPVFNLEPKWYYNINVRQNKKRNTPNNSYNFLSTSINYHPDWINNNINVYNQLSIIPKWGIRRNISNSNFNFEAGIGFGYRFYLLEQYSFSKNNGETALDFHLRLGYTFINSKNRK